MQEWHFFFLPAFSEDGQGQNALVITPPCAQSCAPTRASQNPIIAPDAASLSTQHLSPRAIAKKEKKRLGLTARCCCCVRSTSNINTFTLTALITTSQPPLAHLWGYRASRDALFARIDTAGAAAIQVPRCRQTRSAAASDACLCASRHHLAPLPLRRPVRYGAAWWFRHRRWWSALHRSAPPSCRCWLDASAGVRASRRRHQRRHLRGQHNSQLLWRTLTREGRLHSIRRHLLCWHLGIRHC